MQGSEQTDPLRCLRGRETGGREDAVPGLGCASVYSGELCGEPAVCPAPWIQQQPGIRGARAGGGNLGWDLSSSILLILVITLSLAFLFCQVDLRGEGLREDGKGKRVLKGLNGCCISPAGHLPVKARGGSLRRYHPGYPMVFLLLNHLP